MKKNILPIALAAISMVACTSQKKAEEPAPESKALVLYYSQTGTTQTVAEELQHQLGADIEAIVLEEAYDGDFQQTIARCQEQMASGEVPIVKPLDADLAKYDTIYLGYPVWFGTYAMPIAGLVKDQAFEGKTIITFCTFGSGGLQSSTNNLKEALPQANVIEGYGVRTARVASAPAELNRFLIERGYKEGEIEALPAFMEDHPVSGEEVEIFNQACGDYQYPLGTPVTVAVRATASSTDYLFNAKSTSASGEESMAQIYVTVKNEEGAKPEFTQVVR